MSKFGVEGLGLSGQSPDLTLGWEYEPVVLVQHHCPTSQMWFSKNGQTLDVVELPVQLPKLQNIAGFIEP